jgi:SAM-dependent methyltransferase
VFARPVVQALLIQLGVLAFVVLAMLALQPPLLIPLFGWMAIHSLLVLWLSVKLDLPKWWWVIGPAFVWLLWAGLRVDWPAWVWLLAFISLALVFSNALLQRVPLYLSNTEAQEALLALIKEKYGERKDIQIVDLGCGVGSMTCFLARQGYRVVGVETAPLVWLFAKLRARLFCPAAKIRFQSIWSLPLENTHVAYAFLSPEPMAKLFAKVQTEMPQGSLFVSNSFSVPKFKADEIRPLTGTRQNALHIWHL